MPDAKDTGEVVCNRAGECDQWCHHAGEHERCVTCHEDHCACVEGKVRCMPVEREGGDAE